jgi:hypothetical protein
MQKKTKKISWLRFIVRVLPVIAAVIVFLSTIFAAEHPEYVESNYSKVIYPVFARLLSTISGLLPFSLWDIFWTVLILLLITGIVLTIIRKISIGIFLLRLMQAVSILYIWLYVSWGYNYFRPDIQNRMGWVKYKPAESEFRYVLDSIIFRANSCYIKIDSTGYSQIDSLIEDSFNKNQLELGIAYPNGTRRVKYMIFSTFIAKFGMSGYFGPFFNEVHLNSRLLAIDYPFSLAHEMAHQFGTGSEAEANLIGFVVCAGSDDQRLKYSAYLTMLLYFLNDASGFKDYAAYLNKTDKRVINDLIYRRDYYKTLQNKSLDKVHSVVNDAYLKANNIESGVENYNQVVELVIGFYNRKALK